MNSAGNGRTRAILLAIAGGVVAAIFVGGSAAAAAPAVDTVRSGGVTLNVRAAATSTAKRLGVIKHGSRVSIVCWVGGQRVRGNVRTTTAWDRLSQGGYVSDAFIVHPPNRAIPRCPAAGASKPASPRTPLPAPKPGISAKAASFFNSIGEPARQGYREHKVPASVTMAQAILESGWGLSKLTANDKNYFGIKCFTQGPVASGCHTYNTTECTKAGVCYPTNAVFRVYRSATDSFRDHALFLANSKRYKPAFAFSQNPDRFAAEIHKAGYATDPKYTEKLVKLMRQYDLYRYDR
jgi:flagellar protein FlgJ